MACLLMPARSARMPGRTPSGPGNCSTAICGTLSSVETGGVQLLDDTAMDCLGRNAQQGADEQIAGLDCGLSAMMALTFE